MKLSHSRLVPILAFLLVLLSFALVRLVNPSLCELLESVSYDSRVRLAHARPALSATNLGFVFIDEATIDAVANRSLGMGYGLYWPRHVYGRIVQQLSTEGVGVIGFDVLFPNLRPDLGGAVLPNGEILEGDEFFARQLAQSGNVLLAAEPDSIPPALFLTNAAALGDISTDKDSDGILRRVRAFRTYHLWHPAFLEVEADPDFGIDLSRAEVRTNEVVLHRTELDPIRIPLDDEGRFEMADFSTKPLPAGVPAKARPVERRRVWHMGVRLAAWELGLDLDDALVDLEQGCIELQGDGVKRIIPVDREGRFYIDWAIRPNDPRLTQEPALNFLKRNLNGAGNASREEFSQWNGKLVVIGSSVGAGNDLTDFGATPLDRNTLLVSKHWNVANSIITGRFIRRGSDIQEIGWILLAGIMTGVFVSRFRPVIAFVATLGGIGLYVILAFVLFSHNRLWLPLFMPVAASLTVYVLLTTWRVLFEENERRRVKSVFSKVVSPNVVSELLDAKTLSLGGARREITIFFADVRGFTALTDRDQQAVTEEVRRLGLTGQEANDCYDRQARETLNTVNRYLALVADMIKRHDGTLDKYIGDCVMAFWGAPTPNEKHALTCVRAAIDAQRAIASLNEARALENRDKTHASEELPLLTLGTGISTGLATVGLMGSDAHILTYTVFGREVNLASRLEGVSGRGRIIISESTLEHLLRDDPELAARCVQLESVSVKGIQNEVKIFEVPWREAAPSSAG